MAADESVSWVVVDEDLGLPVEACAYLTGVARGGPGVRHRQVGRVELVLEKMSTGCPRQR
ncbi:hypothetical protein ACBJ59_50420 [Nonomuraea sp. MTCD27]|uniref:hypothetical protein n=1 Tax=Nonomuraea sp. MTCD27 TaxID=1676747 RepID=UPI0035BECF76